MGANNSMVNKGKSMDSGNSMNMSNSRVAIDNKDVCNCRETNIEDVENIDFKIFINYMAEVARC
jgi:hypothetical protein